jgi:hypothetical protein
MKWKTTEVLNFKLISHYRGAHYRGATGEAGVTIQGRGS